MYVYKKNNYSFDKKFACAFTHVPVNTEIP